MPLRPWVRSLVHAHGSLDLDVARAEALRAAYHSRYLGIVDCSISQRPTYVVVLDDVSGTRRTVTVELGDCGSISAAFDAAADDFGLASPWHQTLLQQTWAELVGDS